MPLNVVKNPSKLELFTLLFPVIRMTPSGMISIFSFFLLIFVQIDFSLFSKQIKQVLSLLKIRYLLKSSILKLDIL